MGAISYDELGGGILIQVDAWGFAECKGVKCDECEFAGYHAVDWSPVVTFFWNGGIAIALAAARQEGMIARPITERHAHRQKQIEKLRHQLQHVVEWSRPVEALAAEAEVMHNEVARLRGELAAIARLNIGIASDRARRALGGEQKTEAA
jgi:hypothetical protein